MGGFVAILYGSRHPGHAGGLILLSTFARFDLDRLADGFQAIAGEEIGELARRAYDDEDVTDAEWARVFAAFGPHVPSEEELARRIRNEEVNERGGRLMTELDLLAELPKILSPTLVCGGSADPFSDNRRGRNPRRASSGRWSARGDRRRRPLPVARRARPPVRGD